MVNSHSKYRDFAEFQHSAHCGPVIQSSSPPRLDLPVITEIKKIAALSPLEAQRGYLVRIHGVAAQRFSWQFCSFRDRIIGILFNPTLYM
jgi:hypothetical protein